MGESELKPVYRRVVLKLSGEALAGKREFGLAPDVVRAVAGEIRDVAQLGVQLGIVVGGGNIFRGLNDSARGMDRTQADKMGMLATLINALALQDALESLGSFTRVMSAIDVSQLAESYIQRRAIRHMEKGRLVIFAAGTGNPFFTTDTAAALRAVEIGAQIIIKATNVDGVYDADPASHPEARRFDSLSYIEVLQKRLKVMDATAISLCMDNRLPILVLNMNRPGNIRRAILGESVGTIVKNA